MEIDELRARRQRLTKNTDAIILNMEKSQMNLFKLLMSKKILS